MTIFWGAYTNIGAGVRFRLGLDLTYSPTTITSATTAVTVTIRLLLATEGNSWANDSGSASYSLTGGYATSASGKSWTINSGASYTVIGTWSVSKALTYSAQTFSESASMRPSAVWPGSVSTSGSITIPARPQVAPAAPTGLTKATVSDTSVRLTWTNNVSAAAPYTYVEVMRATDSGGSVRVALLSGSTTTWTNAGLAAGHIYTYRVRGLNSGSGPFSNSVAFSTRPAVPATPTVSKDSSGSIIVQRTGTPSPSAATWRVFEWVNGVRNNTPVVSGLPISQTSWTHASPDPAVTHAYDVDYISADPVWGSGQSPKSATVALQAPPNAPTIIEPNGVFVDNDSMIPLVWQHNAVDMTAQRQYEVRWRERGATDWISSGVQQDSTYTPGTDYYPLSPYELTVTKTYEWQVRSWGSHATASPWSSTGVFILKTYAEVSVITPVAGDVVTGPTTTLKWTFYQEEGATQSSWVILLRDENWEIVQRWTGTGEVTEFKTPRVLQNGRTYSWSIAVTDSFGTKADEAFSGDFTVAFTPPLTPGVTSVWEPLNGSLTLHVDSRSDGVAPEVVSISIERSTDGGTTWSTLAEGLSPDAEWIDWSAPLTEGLLYRVTAVSTTGSSASALHDPGVPALAGECSAFISGGPDLAVSVPLRYTLPRDVVMGRNRVLNRYEGREYTVETSGVAQDYSVRVEVLLLPDAQCERDQVGRVSALELEQVFRLPGPHLYRDSERTFMCALSDLSYGEGFRDSATFTVTRVEDVTASALTDAASQTGPVLVRIADGRYTVVGGGSVQQVNDSPGSWTWVP